MIASTIAYNANPVNGILLKGNAQNYRQTKPQQSVQFPNNHYHYEILVHDNQLYICLHCNHKNTNPNLALLITAYFPIISHHLTQNGYPGLANIPIQGLAGLTIDISHNCKTYL